MPALIVIGGGIAGLSTAMLLARDGHHVTVLERDPAPPPPPQRGVGGVGASRGQPVPAAAPVHGPVPRAARARAAGRVGVALESAGALRFNRMADVARLDHRRVPARRRALRAADRAAADGRGDARPGRGCASRASRSAVASACGASSSSEHRDGRAHVAGVVTDAWRAARRPRGRRRWPAFDAGRVARRPPARRRRSEERADSGYVYYGRHFRSADGAMPPMFGPPLQHYESCQPAHPARRQRPLVGRCHGERQGHRAAACAPTSSVWERIVRSYPLVAHWIDAEPVTGIDVIAKIEDRVRRFDPATAPTGLVAVGDAAACTNPSIGRGASIALMHAVCLRDVLRDAGTGDAVELARRWSAGERRARRARSSPTPSTSTATGRAQIEAEIAGVSTRPTIRRGTSDGR